MKASFNWLKELVALPPDVDAATAATVLTRQGLEVEGTAIIGNLRGVVIAEVLALRPHPAADKLRIVRVRAGGREEDVVCGAPNVPAPGGRVCWAQPGAVLPDGRTLEAREVRGVMSPGMLCSAPELGLGEEGDGILILSPSAPVGAEVAGWLGLPDVIFEVNVTPNRPDALSHLGLARELAAGLGAKLTPPPVGQLGAAGAAPLDVRIDDAQACPRYTAQVVSGLTVGPSPLAVQLRLAACGIRSISNLVDVTNYVLLETGHPLHAFDLDKLVGGVVIRRAGAGETIDTLDGQGRELVAGDIVIADQKGPIALGGVMGGARSEVSASTTRVLLEAATFHPASVRRTSKRLALQSESSYRFERGVDANGIAYASARATHLLAAWGGGVAEGGLLDRYPAPILPRQVTLTLARLHRVTGTSGTTLAEARAALETLGFATVASGDDALTATVPTVRPDVAIAEDLIEEILRISNAFSRPADRARVRRNATSVPNPEGPADRARSLLAALGLSEIASWGFVPRAALEALTVVTAAPQLSDGVVVKNPISADYEVMRTSLLPGLAAAMARNLARGMSDVALFEVGPLVRRGLPSQPPEQTTHAAALMTGHAAGWLKPGEALDFYDARTVLEELLAGLGCSGFALRGPAGLVPFLHPGVSAEVWVNDKPVGCVGELHPKVARRLGLDVRAFFLGVSLDALGVGARVIKGHAPPRFPATTRDVSFWIDTSVAADDMRAAFVSAGETRLRDVVPLEDFRDPRYCPPGKKGMLWTMTYRADDRTLTDPEVDAAHAQVIAALQARHTIALR